MNLQLFYFTSQENSAVHIELSIPFIKMDETSYLFSYIFNVCVNYHLGFFISLFRHICTKKNNTSRYYCSHNIRVHMYICLSIN